MLELRVQRLWGRVDWRKYRQKLDRRLELLNQLYLIYPEVQLQAEFINGARSKLFGFDTSDPRIYAPAVHYRVLPNEVVFDFDGGSKEDIAAAVRVLKTVGAKPFVGHSGNRGWHVHVLFSPPNGDIENFVKVPEVVKFRNTLFDILLSLLETFGVDTSLVDSNMKEVHTIRSFYSVNLKGRRWKLPAYGDGYELWCLSKEMYARVLDEMRTTEKVEEILSGFDGDASRSGKSNRIWWIEKILKHPERCSDGRRRLIMYAIVPYLLNVRKLPPAEVHRICEEWVRRTPRGDDNGLKYLIKSEIKSYSSSGVLPMSLEKIKEKVPEINKVIS